MYSQVPNLSLIKLTSISHHQLYTHPSTITQFLQSMEMFLNKKNLNRISRKSATIIQPSSIEKNLFSTISTFRSIKPTKKLLQDSQINKPPPIKMENILTYCRHLSSRRKNYSLLSRPKVNFKQEKCQRNTAHDTFYQSARKRLTQTNRKNEMMNRTISFAVSIHQSKIKSLYEQDPIDLQRDQFKRRHQSLRKYQENSGQQLNEISRNTILSNDLGKLPTTEIIKIKQRKQMQKEFLMGLTKFGQALSNEVAQSEQMREFFTALPSGKTIDENERRKRLEEQMVGLYEGLEKPVIEKYRNLLDTIQDSELRFPTQKYEDYDKVLSSKYASGRTRKRTSKVLLNCAEEWR